MQKRSDHFGLNSLDPAAYGGFGGWLAGCINDASSLAELAAARGCTTRIRWDWEATKRNLTLAFHAAAETLGPGDVYFPTISGHGVQAAEPGAPPNSIHGSIGPAASFSTEFDGKDEAICLWDGPLWDWELFSLLRKFRAGVRVVMVLDLCHSGGMDRADGRPGTRPRQLPRRTTDCPLPSDRVTRGPAANVAMLCACRESEVAFDGFPNGVFTRALLDQWPDWPLRISRPTKLGAWFDRAAATVHHRTKEKQHPVAKIIGSDSIWEDFAL